MHLCYTGNTELGRTTYLVSAMHRNEVAYEDDIPYKARGTGTDRACEQMSWTYESRTEYQREEGEHGTGFLV
ncbi:hypothetical protein K360107B91_41340 [Enterocloster bolteae]